jgi:hypothetical protein
VAWFGDWRWSSFSLALTSAPVEHAADPTSSDAIPIHRTNARRLRLAGLVFRSSRDLAVGSSRMVQLLAEAETENGTQMPSIFRARVARAREREITVVFACRVVAQACDVEPSAPPET